MVAFGILSIIPNMEQEIMAAAVNAMPTDPHSMILSVWQVDYSAIAAQLKTIPQLEAADFRFGEAAYWRVNSHVNLAVVENPTKQMVIELYRSNQEARKKEAFDALRADVHSVQWDYSPNTTFYEWDPAGKVLRLLNPARAHSAYPREVALDDITDLTDWLDLRRYMERQSELVTIGANYLKIGNLPSSKVEMSPTAVVVSYVGQLPDYLPSLEKALENTGKLKIEAVR